MSRGSLTSLKLKIPWANLSSKPVLVQLDGIYLEAHPVDLNKCSTSESQQAIYLTKMKILDTVEKAIVNKLHTKESILNRAKNQDVSYVQKLTTKILDNLEVTITHVHLRYEDNQSVPDTVFSAGIMVDGLTLKTTDDKWSSAFINRKTSDDTTVSLGSSSCIHKLGTLTDLGIYWNTSSSSESYSNDLSSAQWEAKMMGAMRGGGSMIDRMDQPSPKFGAIDNNNSSSVSKGMSFVLQPNNRCSLRVKHHAAVNIPAITCDDSTPTIDVSMDSTDLLLRLNDLQYQQMLSVIQHFTVLDTRRLLVAHRPTLRPTADPKAWWRYAYLLLTGREFVCSKVNYCWYLVVVLIGYDSIQMMK